jgi:3',5'-cyclic AMP phosphodiesterase CpdA
LKAGQALLPIIGQTMPGSDRTIYMATAESVQAESGARRRLRLLRPFAVALVAAGTLILLIDVVVTVYYSRADTPPLLPPAGEMQEAPASFGFAVIGDSCMRRHVLQEVFRDLGKRNPRFALCLGDVAASYSSTHFEWVLQVFREVSGELPLYLVPGNHDALPRTRGGKPVRGDLLRYYKRAFGQNHYWFAHGETLFIGLDNSLGGFGAEQFAWLEKVLERIRPQYRTCILFMHRPVVDPETGEGYLAPHRREGQLGGIFKQYDQEVGDLRAYTEEHAINLLLCGHIHQYAEVPFGQGKVVTVRPSGQEQRGYAEDSSQGYLWVEVDNEAGKVQCTDVPLPVTAESSFQVANLFLELYPELRPLPWIGLGSLLAGLFGLVVFR